MSDEPDRVAMVSDLTKLAERLEKHIEDRFVRESETMRRHFDIMAEDVRASVKLVAEVNAHHSTILDNHELRLKKIEKRRA